MHKNHTADHTDDENLEGRTNEGTVAGQVSDEIHAQQGNENHSDTETDRTSRLTLPWQIILVAVLVLADQLTKYLAVVHLKGQAPLVLIRGVLELYYLENQGAAFSMLQNQQVFFYVLTIIFLVLAGWFLAKVPSTAKYTPLRISLLVLCAGAVGNLIDRIVHKYVVDFIYFVIIDFPVFNVADIYVTLGVIVLICLVLFHYKENDLRAITDKKTEA